MSNFYHQSKVIWYKEGEVVKLDPERVSSSSAGTRNILSIDKVIENIHV